MAKAILAREFNAILKGEFDCDRPDCYRQGHRAFRLQGYGA
jgi:hypothetical protein